MITLKKSKADLYYQQIKNNPDRLTTEHVEEFLNQEATNVILLKTLIDQCTDDTSYNSNLPLMSQCIQHIRTSKLFNVKEQFGFFEFKKKKYFDKLLKNLEYI